MATTTETTTLTTPPNPIINTSSNEFDTPNDPYKAALDSLKRDGFVVLPASLFPSFDLPSLRTAASHLAATARTGKWPYIRTLPKQFPPWGSDPSAGIWGVQHLMHPSNPDHLTFAKSYFDEELLRYVQTLVGCAREELVMELYNMLVRPDKAFELRWHRDDIPASATDEEETSRLGHDGWHAQWNLALYDDASLIVVPGSHKRARTAAERGADPYEANLPGQLVVKLKAGEVAFYDNNILHRGVYDATKERMTLHGCIGSTRGDGSRARNVLQHGVGDWVRGYAFEDAERLGEEWVGRARVMREKLVSLGEKAGDVGFFSKDE
ncbi:phytanoyl-CoA dioxygenase family protein [Pleomassaria siparia CBS 279.74]|uniref:Phytanoyl-CoA dioxygenase family protein n=1 Tax=Pleomassaria siparia CBS 279.74 TaxID=1314801 RepID=A0A6G1KS89_9PLEO|nr:phytanoyl-CoA dioxygenase family protein [Pleomassaria siparia CBS 279.74]